AQLPDWGDALLELHGKLRPSDPGWAPHGWPLVALGALGTAIVGARLVRGWRGGALAAFACVSHSLVDYITGYKPTWPGGPAEVGLGLYGHAGADLLLECAVIILGWALWRGSLTSSDADAPVRAWPYAGLAWGLLAVLLGLQLWADLVMAGQNATFW
nr:hypothetical protein [Candidatus Eremiobacteraeota bacterium]